MRVDTLKLMKRLSQRARCVTWMLAILAVAFTLTPEQAQAQQARRITFDEAVRVALDQNYFLKRSANNVEIQSINVAREKWNFWPNLSLSSSSGQNRGRRFVPELNEITSSASTSLSTSVSTGINVFNGFGDVASLKQARLQVNARDNDYERQRQTVVFTVMSQYLDLIAQRELIRIRQENLTAQQQLLTQIEEFVRVGQRATADLFQQQANTAVAEANLLDAQRFSQLAEGNLIQTLQLDPLGVYDFVVPQVDETVLVPEQYNVRSMMENAFDRRLDLQASQIDIQAAEQGVRIARSNYWPSIGFGFTTSFRYDDSRTQTDFSTQFIDERSTNFGFNMSFPIFDRFLTRSSVQQARIQLRNAQLDLDNMRHDIALQVRQAYLDYLIDEKQLDVTDKQYRASEQALEAEQARYNVGVSTLVELTQARATFEQASSDQIEAKYNFLFRKKLIEYHIGVLDPTGQLFQ